MRTNGRTDKVVVSLDALVITASVLVSWTLRAQFPQFRVNLLQLLFFLPYVMFLRVFANVFFEHYKSGTRNLRVADILRLCKHHLALSGVFLLLRLLSPVREIRMPLSMIGIEYVMTTLGMILVRSAYTHMRRGRSPRGLAPRTRKALLVCGADEASRGLADRLTLAGEGLNVVALFTDEPLLWNTDVGSVRVVGGYERLRQELEADEQVQCLVLTPRVSARERRDLALLCAHLGVDPLLLAHSRVRRLAVADVFSTEHEVERVPEEAAQTLSAHGACILGAEASICHHLALTLETATERRPHEGWVTESADDSAAENQREDLVIDLRLYLRAELGQLRFPSAEELCRQLRGVALPSVRPHLKTVRLMVVPDPRAGYGRLLDCVPGGVAVLCVGQAATIEACGSLGMHSDGLTGLWDSPVDVVGFIAKALCLALSGGRLFVGRSPNAMEDSDLRRLTETLEGGRRGTSTGTPAGGMLESPCSADPSLSPTTYFGLFEAERDQTRSR